MKKYVKTIIETILIVIIAFVVFHYVLLPVSINGDSMYPFLQDGEFSLMDALHTGKDDIDRFDIVVLYYQELDKLIIKRVIGLPGETIEYKDDKLYIDGEYYQESFLESSYVEQSKKDHQLKCFTDDLTITLKDDELFVLGDNRMISLDSRTFGPVSYKDIKAKNGLVLYPFNQMKWME